MVQGTGVDGDLGSDGSLMDCAGIDSGAPVIPKVVDGPADAGELGIEDSAEFVPSTIPEPRPAGVYVMLGSGKDKLEDGLATVPLRFTARGPLGRRGTGKCGRPHGYGTTGSQKQSRGCLVLGPEGEVPSKGMLGPRWPRCFGIRSLSVLLFSALGISCSSGTFINGSRTWGMRSTSCVRTS
ncbi:hypothetical protein Salat_0867900 [Sesamum alatum]|uniref:Uncharacterized protein n=1 Tax=Sesamum alatum TaxID=300844 RepID=A0AAE2CR18_9LAMI|nr:hypothetical protein Salat_0867900 [Sesamum alatum]